MVKILVFLLGFSSCLQYLEYKLGINYGRKIHDYSGNSRYGLNANSLTTTVNDMVSTDRGAHFNGIADFIQGPTNLISSITFPMIPVFSVVAWVIHADHEIGQIFQLYTTCSLIKLNCLKTNSNLELIIKNCLSGISTTYTLSTPANSFLSNLWVMLALSYTAGVVSLSANGVTLASSSISLSAEIEYTVRLGSYDTDSMKGMIFYFTITDSANPNAFMAPTSSSCIFPMLACTVGCTPAIVIPGLATGCLSVAHPINQSANKEKCGSSGMSCSMGVMLTCTCSSNSCEIDYSMRSCSCVSNSGNVPTSCNCLSGYLVGTSSCYLVCLNQCQTCSDAATCDTCKTLNASPDMDIGCICDATYYNTTELITNTACKPCNSECATCTQANICTSCMSSNATPDISSGCKCNNFYGGVAPLTSATSCVACDEECSTCEQINICLLCKATYATPDSTKGCKCNNFYGGVAPLISATSCVACDQECLTCTQINICTLCKATYATPDATKGCKCNTFYGGVAPLTSATSCVACDEECSTCEQINICLLCKATYAIPDSTKGCKCINFYGGVAPLNFVTSCFACHQECLTCDHPNKCINCRANNASPDAIEGCLCNEGYWGIAPLILTTSCAACYNECLLCSEAFLCTICRDPNAIPDGIQGCKCKSNFFNSTVLGISTTSCVRCNSECMECVDALQCTSCISSNAHADPTQGCRCNIGFWGTPPLNSELSCTACYEDCFSCSTALLCTTCKALNAHPARILGCECDDGYYSVGSMALFSSCNQCNIDCLKCKEADKCTICKSTNTEPDLIKGCICKPGFFYDALRVCQPCNTKCLTCNASDSCLICSQNNTDLTSFCSCREGYYNSSSVPHDCLLCPLECRTCTNSTFCISCNVIDDSPTSLGKCECPAHSFLYNSNCRCNEGYYLTNSYGSGSVCLPCGPDCKSCPNSYDCSSCLNPYATLINNICVIQCNSSQTMPIDRCVDCPELCIRCEKDLSCSVCVENAYLNDTECVCNSGYKQFGKSCNKMMFFADLNVNKANRVRLLFSKIPDITLIIEDFHIEIKTNNSYTVMLITKSNTEYYFLFNFTDSIPQGTSLIIDILKYPLISTELHTLSNYNLTGALNIFTVTKQSKIIKLLTAVTGAASSVAVTSSVGMAIVSNPASAWILISTIQLIYYMPINSNPLTPTLRAFCTSLGSYNILPNFMIYIFDSNTSSTPYPEAEKFGVSTSVFWINIGPTLTGLLIVLAGFPFIKILSILPLGKISEKAKGSLGNYRYNTFLRFWIQAYVDIGIFSFIQIKSNSDNPYVGHFNTFTATVLIVIHTKLIVILTPATLFVTTYISHKRLWDPSDHTYKQRFGSLFDELKHNKGLLPLMHYPLYFLRRLCFIIAQVYLNKYLKIQVGLNIAFTILMIAYLFIIRPFKETLLYISDIAGEICVLIAFSISAFFLVEISVKGKFILESIIIFSVLGGMLIQFIIISYNFYKSLKEKFEKFMRYRERKVIRAIKNLQRLTRNVDLNKGNPKRTATTHN